MPSGMDGLFTVPSLFFVGTGTMNRCTIFSDAAIRLFLEAARELSISLSEEKIHLFDRYYQELLLWNQKVNLTRITEERDVVLNHFVDSLVPARFIPPDARLADIGAGAGFPGIPLKIVRPDVEVTLIEASSKKIAFLRHAVRVLGLKKADVRHGRVEKRGSWVPEFSVSIGRAVSSLPDFLSVARLIVVPGGSIVAMRGPRFEEEIADVRGLLPGMNLCIEEAHAAVLPVNRARRGIIVFRVEA